MFSPQRVRVFVDGNSVRCPEVDSRATIVYFKVGLWSLSQPCSNLFFETDEQYAVRRTSAGHVSFPLCLVRLFCSFPAYSVSLLIDQKKRNRSRKKMNEVTKGRKKKEQRKTSEREREREEKKYGRRGIHARCAALLHRTGESRCSVAPVQNEVTASRPIKYRHSGFN